MKSLEEIQNTPGLRIATVGVDGGHGYIWRAGKEWASVIWSYGGGWEHVSISPKNKTQIPTWNDMCMLKDMFFNEDEVVVQYHPAKSEYVNQLRNCLHLWRPIEADMPTPPSIMVGRRDGQSVPEMMDEIRKLEGK